MSIGRLLLRASVGGFFVGHGTQKLFGWFGGHGLKNTAQAFEGMGLRPGVPNAAAAGLAEAGGGAALALGYQTPLASSALIATMLTAIHRVHLKNGPWVTNGGYEYNAVLIAAAVILAEVGPGGLSVDALRGAERSGSKWALTALGLGAAGAAGAHLLTETLGSRTAEADVASPAPTDAGAVDVTAEPVSA
jgi:putative oxidoreductase